MVLSKLSCSLLIAAGFTGSGAGFLWSQPPTQNSSELPAPLVADNPTPQSDLVVDELRHRQGRQINATGNPFVAMASQVQ